MALVDKKEEAQYDNKKLAKKYRKKHRDEGEPPKVRIELCLEGIARLTSANMIEYNKSCTYKLLQCVVLLF